MAEPTGYLSRRLGTNVAQTTSRSTVMLAHRLFHCIVLYLHFGLIQGEPHVDQGAHVFLVDVGSMECRCLLVLISSRHLHKTQGKADHELFAGIIDGLESTGIVLGGRCHAAIPQNIVHALFEDLAKDEHQRRLMMTPSLHSCCTCIAPHRVLVHP